MDVLLNLSKGYTAVIDDVDAERVLQYPWSAHVSKRADGSIKTVYGKRSLRWPNGKKGTQLLHRFIMGVTDPTVEVDHFDHDGLNNRRTNLRICSKTQNHANQFKTHGMVQYKGVSVAATAGKFLAGIKAGGKRYHLGTFNTGKAAALAYDAAARRLFGDFALTNFPIEAS